MRIFGTRHADVLIGTDGDDEIRGLRGDDAIYGGRGNDYIEDVQTERSEIRGGLGDDEIHFGRGFAYGGLGDDNIQVSGGGWAIGGPGRDTLIGRGWLWGDNGPDDPRQAAQRHHQRERPPRVGRPAIAHDLYGLRHRAPGGARRDTDCGHRLRVRFRYLMSSQLIGAKPALVPNVGTIGSSPVC